jgi:CHAT domain-containing protein/tetratricopeptide (TPR) repeat protein
MILKILIPAASLLALPQTLEAKPLPDRVELGRDANGQPCIATRGWSVGNDGINFEADQGYSITCRGIAAATVQGYVSVPSPRAELTSTDAASCGAPRELTAPELGTVTVRNCVDSRIRLPVVDVAVARKDGTYRGAVVVTALAPLEELLRLVTGSGSGAAPDRNERRDPELDISSLAPAPVVASAGGALNSREYTVETAIQQGLVLIRSGRHVEASRLFNDAITQFSAVAPLIQAELRLNAALADSNISQFEAASEHFEAAAKLVSDVSQSDTRANLETQAAVYRGLDAINRQQWQTALDNLDTAAGANFPLNDAVVLSQMNQTNTRRNTAAVVGVANAAQLAALVIDAQRNWARSVAHLALGEIEPSSAAIRTAAASAKALQASVSPDSIIWLRAGLERQQGRIAARANDFKGAVAGFDCAILTLQNAALPTSSGCLFAGQPQRSTAAAASNTVIAETQIERAGLLARIPGTAPDRLLREYSAAVETLGSGSGVYGSAPPALSGYLDALTDIAALNPSAAVIEPFFEALQTTGEPAIAREFIRLQSAVAADSSVQALLADRGDLEREATRLRYEIGATSKGDSEIISRLETERQRALAALAEVNAKLPPAVNTTEDQPVTAASVLALLKPDEVYLKLAALNNSVYAIAMAREKTLIYKVGASAIELDLLARSVINSARSYRGSDGATRIRPFKVDESFALFSLIAGPAKDIITSAKAIVFEPVGELRNLPASILVANAESVAAHAAGPRNDYSNVAFVGRGADLSTALSPRSFVLVRSRVAASTASRPFLGLGENAPARMINGPNALQPVQLANGCRVAWQDWANTSNANTPISAREIRMSAAALGIDNAPMIIGADFNNRNLLRAGASGELAQYEVLHFATHGLPATDFSAEGCETKLPPALLTTLTAPDAEGLVESDGLLRFDEVAKLRLNANLVFLSACETASGNDAGAARLAGVEDATPSLDGLVRAFLVANARAVVATMWSVPDSPQTDAFLVSFYRTGRTASIASSLREAQRTLIEQQSYSHPYFWGAYFIVGDGAKTMLTSPSETPATIASAK